MHLPAGSSQPPGRNFKPTAVVAVAAAFAFPALRNSFFSIGQTPQIVVGAGQGTNLAIPMPALSSYGAQVAKPADGAGN